MKFLTKAALAALGVFLWCTPTDAQTIDIGPNEYAFQFTGDPDFGLFFNSTSQRYEFRNGSANSIFGFSANNGDMTTNLSFSSGSDLLIDNNRYAFRAVSNPNYGLFFSSTATEYQFLNNSAIPIFAINANSGKLSTDIDFENGKAVVVNPSNYAFRSSTAPQSGLFYNGTDYQFKNASDATLFSVNTSNGNTRVNNGLRIGNTNSTFAGYIRWTGTDFEGYTGSS